MGKRFKIFCPVASALVFSPALLPPYVHHIHFESPHPGDSFSTFVFEVKLNKLAEDGPFGLLIRYDEKTKDGYTYKIFRNKV